MLSDTGAGVVRSGGDKRTERKRVNEKGGWNSNLVCFHSVRKMPFLAAYKVNKDMHPITPSEMKQASL